MQSTLVRNKRNCIQVISRKTWKGLSFQQGVDIYLQSINIIKGPSEDRMLMTGLHTVCDIYCVYCLSVVGWKYVRNCLFRKGHLNQNRDIKKESIY
jgi:hypothetical protein